MRYLIALILLPVFLLTGCQSYKVSELQLPSGKRVKYTPKNDKYLKFSTLSDRAGLDAAYAKAVEVAKNYPNAEIKMCAVTGSMFPELDWDTIIVLAPLTAQPKVGDIVGYMNFQGQQVLHRLVKIEGDRYIFKGDNLKTKDREYISAKQLVGKAIFVAYFNRGEEVRPKAYAASLNFNVTPYNQTREESVKSY